MVTVNGADQTMIKVIWVSGNETPEGTWSIPVADAHRKTSPEVITHKKFPKVP